MEESQGLRITTWNVNGIRNPFGYQPWRQERSFAAMFDILEADIVVMQETKIQRKDLKDDMVLVPGWDVYFSLPKHKKGYSGVAIYTRTAVCAPIRAEEGITGVLTPPNSSTSFCDLPEDEQIGGYPTARQLADCALDSTTLDSEGRCVILEFPAFVLIGTYCPANRDETRDEFRIGFLTALDARVRNLVAAGKRVFLTGDLNIIGDPIDTAKVDEQLKKQGINMEEFLSTPARRIFNQLVEGKRVIGERDEEREKPVLWDICRSFHPTRRGMFTCWEQKINARPGNFGSRIDYVLCSTDWKDWFCESNIQEGLMGSDHCPVYAVLKQKVSVGDEEVDIRDVMSDGMFKGGVRQREWSQKDLLPTSARLIQEFAQRRSIRDMFVKKPSIPRGEEPSADEGEAQTPVPAAGNPQSFQEREAIELLGNQANEVQSNTQAIASPTVKENGSVNQLPVQTSPKLHKRPNEAAPSARPTKRGKATSNSKTTARGQAQSGKGQSSLIGFFKPKAALPDDPSESKSTTSQAASNTTSVDASLYDSEPSMPPTPVTETPSIPGSANNSPSKFRASEQKDVHDPIVSKESWGKLLAKRVVPRCEHNEPCISLLTKKPGVNCGRSFFICPRPLGPSGAKEKGTQWRCETFIWSSDWKGD